MGMGVDGDPFSVFDAALQRGHRQLPLPQQNLRQVQKAVQMLQDKHASSFLVQIQKVVQMNPLPPMCMSGCITSHVYDRIATLFLSRDGKMHYIPCVCQVAASP